MAVLTRELSQALEQQAATSKDAKAYDPKTYVPEYLKDDPNYNPDPYAKHLKGKGEDPNNASDNWWDSYGGLGPAISGAQGGHASTGATGDHGAVNAQQLAVTTAKLALIPPSLIFIVGIGLTWALRGFR
jgi:hypothetical protein